MKNQKSTIVWTMLSAAVIALILQNRGGASPPPPQQPSFSAHYKEIDTTIAAGATSQTVTLPVLDRAVRVSISSTCPDGFYTFPQIDCFYATQRGEFAVQGAGVISDPNQFPDGLGLGGLTLFGGTNGAVSLRNDADTTATVHIAAWY
jgi:hypothetical protein